MISAENCALLNENDPSTRKITSCVNLLQSQPTKLIQPFEFVVVVVANELELAEVELDDNVDEDGVDVVDVLDDVEVVVDVVLEVVLEELNELDDVDDNDVVGLFVFVVLLAIELELPEVELEENVREDVVDVVDGLDDVEVFDFEVVVLEEVSELDEGTIDDNEVGLLVFILELDELDSELVVVVELVLIVVNSKELDKLGLVAVVVEGEDW